MPPQGIEFSSNVGAQNVDDLSSQFSSTFMLDEELEIEQKAIKKDDLTSSGRYIIDSSLIIFIRSFLVASLLAIYLINITFCKLFVISVILSIPLPPEKKKKKKNRI